MKFKKFLIIILSVALLSCFAVSTFATSATIPDYGFYISPGDYVFSERFSPGSFNSRVSLFFRFTTNIDDSVYSSIDFNNPGVQGQGSYILFYNSVSESDLTVYYDGWNNDAYRYITVLDGFYIYDINIYQWWISNVTRVDSGYDNNLLDGILSSFTFIGEWIAGAANAVTPMFWDGEALTVVGTLSVAGLSFAVVFLLISLVSSFMKFRS